MPRLPDRTAARVICEHRTYRLHPGRLQEYLGVFDRHPVVLDLLRRNLHGFWVAESGALNTVHHLWRYESREARAAARAAVANAPGMGDFFAAVTPLLQSQRSVVFEGELHPPADEGAASGCFDLFELTLRPDADAAAGERALADAATALSRGFVPVARLRRGWLETAGPPAAALHVLRSHSLSARDRHCAAAGPALAQVASSGVIAEAHHVFLLPVPFSPWR